MRLLRRRVRRLAVRLHHDGGRRAAMHVVLEGTRGIVVDDGGLGDGVLRGLGHGFLGGGRVLDGGRWAVVLGTCRLGCGRVLHGLVRVWRVLGSRGHGRRVALAGLLGGEELRGGGVRELLWCRGDLGRVLLRRVLLHSVVGVVCHVLRGIGVRRVRARVLWRVLRHASAWPVLRDGEVDLWVHAGLRVADRHVCGVLRLLLALLVFKADLPVGQKLGPGLDVAECRVFARTFELTSNNVFEGVVGNDVVVGALVFHRDGLFHQAAILELVAVDQRTAEAPLLIRG